MHVRIKVLMAALTAVLALSLAAGTATALRSFSIAGESRLTLTGRVTFEAGELGEIICDTTFVKTISRVIPKVFDILIGRVTDVRVARPETCRKSEGIEAVRRIEPLIRSPEVLLWRIYFQSFTGTLPTIRTLLFVLDRTQVLIEFKARSTELGCLYENEAPETIGIDAEVDAAGVIGRLRTQEPPDNQTEIVADLRFPFFACPDNPSFIASVTPSQRTTVRLI